MDMHSTAHIMRNCQFVSLRHIHIAERSIIGHDCLLDAKGSIFIGCDVNVSSYVKIITARHRIDDISFEGVDRSVTIGNRVWVASAALILQGVDIGEGAVVAAGAVVTKDVDSFTVVGGIPAKVIGERNRNIHYTLQSKPSRFL
jgi:maltose O-acetyltransferase